MAILTVKQTRAILAGYTHRCDPGCKGWFVNDEAVKLERCDDCAHDNGVADRLDDDAIERLPEAQEALKAEAHSECGCGGAMTLREPATGGHWY
jgi:hypothetical protein